MQAVGHSKIVQCHATLTLNKHVAFLINEQQQENK